MRADVTTDDQVVLVTLTRAQATAAGLSPELPVWLRAAAGASVVPATSAPTEVVGAPPLPSPT